MNQDQTDESTQKDWNEDAVRHSLRRCRLATFATTVVVVSIGFTDPALAAQIGDKFCSTDMAKTIKNIFDVIKFGGPLIGGTIALGATVAIPAVRRADLKKELKVARNQGIIWGVIVAPIGGTIVTFIVNVVVVGGSSCTL